MQSCSPLRLDSAFDFRPAAALYLFIYLFTNLLTCALTTLSVSQPSVEW